MPQEIAEFSDPRLVAIYDAVNSYAPDAQPGFYLALAAELGATSIVDLGCGTGLITRELARRGYRVTGVEPARLMLDMARGHPDGDLVTWVRGDASQLGARDADLAIMTGHVAQFFLEDREWHTALQGLARALGPGGHLAFESRNPGAREWERWTPELRRSIADPADGLVEAWTEVDQVHGGIVECTNHYLFELTGEELTSTAELRFRTEEEIRESLSKAGFTAERMYGDWDRRPVTAHCRELIVVARK